MYFTILLAAVNAQFEDCSLTNFQPCLDVIENYKQTTCAMIQTSSPNYYDQCLCYQMYHQSLCYQQCPDNAAVQQNLTNIVLPQLNSLCASVGLDPNNLPVPPAWQVYFQKIFTITAGYSPAPATQTSTTTTTTVRPVSNAGTSVEYMLGSVIALLGYFAQ